MQDLGHLDALVEAAGPAVVAIALYSRVRTLFLNDRRLHCCAEQPSEGWWCAGQP